MTSSRLWPVTLYHEDNDSVFFAVSEDRERSVSTAFFARYDFFGEKGRLTQAGSGDFGLSFPIKAHSTVLLPATFLAAPSVVRNANVSFSEGTLGLTSALSSLNDMADYLTTGFWDYAGESQQMFNLGTSGFSANNGELLFNVSGYSGDANGLTDARADLVREVFKIYGEVLGITLTETTSTGNEVDLFFSDNGSGAYSGTSYDPSSGFIDYAIVNVNVSWSGGTSSYNDYTLQAFFHEIGHALGLGHLGPYNSFGTYGVDNIFVNDSWQASIMSYFSQAENTYISASELFLQGPMAVDWIALDSLYGPQGYGVDHAFLGDTVYGFNTNIPSDTSDIWASYASFAHITATTIVDGGGIDTLDFSGFSANQTINLALSSGADTAPSLSDIGGAIGNLSIAVGTVIENAIGGSGIDRIFGNFADNILTGNGGGDLIFGYGGSDTISGGDAADTLNGGSGDDDVSGDGGADKIVDPFGTDTLSGNSGNDIVSAFSGGNALYGGSENDILTGGIGADSLYGNAGRDILIGDISGTFFGNDVLQGGSGNDLLTGGGGADQFVFNPADGTDTIGVVSVNYVTPTNSTVTGTDFQSGLDTVVLSGFGYTTPEQAFAHLTNQSGTATFSDQGTTIVFYGLSVTDLSADDFVPVLSADELLLV